MTAHKQSKGKHAHHATQKKQSTTITQEEKAKHARWSAEDAPHGTTAAKDGEKEIKLYKVVTDFDKVLQLVQEKGVVSEATVRKAFGLSAQQFALASDVLQKTGKVTLEYPLFGGVKLVAMGYRKKKVSTSAQEAIQISDAELDAESKKIEDRKRIE